jgi:hypothetical protein
VLFPWLERCAPPAELDALAALLTKSRPPVWSVMTEDRVDEDDAIGAGPLRAHAGVASDEAAR